MNKWSRIQAALRHEAADRIPLSLWRHFHREDRTAEGLAEATLALARQYDLDLVKLTPSGLYAVEDWVGEWIVYPGTDHDPPYLGAAPISNPSWWRRLPLLDPTAGALGRELRTIQLVAEGLGGETPLLMTIFSPLTLAFKMAGKTIGEDLRQHPTHLHAGLAIIAETTARFARAALDAGADGLFFATQLASHRWLTPQEYAECGQRYDLAVLSQVTSQAAITVLHLHGTDVFFDLANRYPIHAVSWHDRETPPSLAQARHRTDRAFMTGLDRELLGHGPVASIQAQVREVLDHTRGHEKDPGRGLILAPSCVVPTTASADYLQAVRDLLIPRQHGTHNHIGVNSSSGGEEHR